MTTSYLSTITTYDGTYLGFRFQIKHRPRKDILPPTWTYYVYIHEDLVQDFDSLWLPPKLSEIREGRKPWLSYAYEDTWVANLPWHGGVTFYSKHGELPGYRCVEFGCDYAHLWDNAEYLTIEDILPDVIVTITALQPHKKKP